MADIQVIKRGDGDVLRTHIFFVVCDYDIVIRVSIVGDQHAPIVIASKFDCERVDLVHRCNNGFTVDLKKRIFLVDGCCSELSIDAWVNINVTSNGVQFNSMGAERALWDLLVFFLYRALVIEDWVVKRSFDLRLPQGVLKLTLSVNVHIGVHIMNERTRMHVGVGSHCMRMQIWMRPMHVRVGTVHVRARAERSFLDLAGFFMHMFVGMLFWFRNLVSNVMAIALEFLKLVVVVSLPFDIDNDVVEWVSIIRNEGATLHVAS